MKITCIDDARSYERVLYALRSLPQGKAVRSYVDDVKRDLRAFYHRPDGCVRIITADYDRGWQLITLTAKTKEDADAEFNALYYRDCAPSPYDCTGQMFTVFYKLFKRNGRWMAYHHFAKQIKELGIYQWQLADAVGVSNYSFTIWMRHEMTGERLARVQAALDELKKQQANSRQ